MKIKRQDRVSNEAVLLRANLPSIETTVAGHRLRWVGHVSRMPETRLPRQILFSQLESGTRPRGAPRRRFRDQLKDTLLRCANDQDSWEHLAEDRAKWRRTVMQGTAHMEDQRRAEAEAKRQQPGRSARRSVSRREKNRARQTARLPVVLPGLQGRAKARGVRRYRSCREGDPEEDRQERCSKPMGLKEVDRREQCSKPPGLKEEDRREQCSKPLGLKEVDRRKQCSKSPGLKEVDRRKQCSKSPGLKEAIRDKIASLEATVQRLSGSASTEALRKELLDHATRPAALFDPRSISMMEALPWNQGQVHGNLVWPYVPPQMSPRSIAFHDNYRGKGTTFHRYISGRPTRPVLQPTPSTIAQRFSWMVTYAGSSGGVTAPGYAGKPKTNAALGFGLKSPPQNETWEKPEAKASTFGVKGRNTAAAAVDTLFPPQDEPDLAPPQTRTTYSKQKIATQESWNNDRDDLFNLMKNMLKLVEAQSQRIQGLLSSGNDNTTLGPARPVRQQPGGRRRNLSQNATPFTFKKMDPD
ncbi:transcription termination factor, RNA polymerase II [Branchiostoma belcheri]|nr:transcription termination factor, RNA polymerase II [Branchiostoma belcheri]